MCVELFSLRDKVALVTGAGKGLGKSMALALSESGAHVAVVSRTRSDIETTAKEIRENNVKSIPIVADVTRQEDVAKMVKKAIISKIPMKRIGKPSDLSGAVVFLASKASDYITGQVIFVDGGFSVQ